MAMMSAFQKELMTKLKPKGGGDAEKKSGKADTPKDEDKSTEETEAEKSPEKSPTSERPIQFRAHQGKGDGSDDPFDSVMAKNLLSTAAAQHKIGVVRNAKQKRSKPARARSVSSDTTTKSDSFDMVDGAEGSEETKEQLSELKADLPDSKIAEEKEEPESVAELKFDDEAEKSSKESAEESKAITEDEDVVSKSVPPEEKAVNSSEEVKSTTSKTSTKIVEDKQSSKTAEARKEDKQPSNTAEARKEEKQPSKTTEARKEESLSVKTPDEVKKPIGTTEPQKTTDAKKKELSRVTIGATMGSSPTTSRTGAVRPSQLGSSSSNSAIRAMGSMMMAPILGGASDKKSPTSSGSVPTAKKASPTFAGSVTVPTANKTSPTADISPKEPMPFSGGRRRSSTRELARRFEAGGSGETNNNDSKPSYGKSISCEEQKSKSRPAASMKVANSDNALDSPVISPSRLNKTFPDSKSPQSPSRKLSHPVQTPTVSKTSPQRKASEPAVKLATETPSSTVASRLGRLSETSPTKDTKRPSPEVTRARAVTTSSISERANAFASKSAATPATPQVRKLSAMGDRPRTRVMDMMKKFEA